MTEKNSRGIVNLVIDVQYDPEHNDHPLLTPEQRKAYVKKINDSVAALAKQGIPTIYIAIGDNSIAHPSSETDDPKRLKKLQDDLHMTELNIKPGDVIFEKRFMSGFTDIFDILSDADGSVRNSVLEKYVMSQRQDGEEYKDAIFSKTKLIDLLTAKHAKEVTIMGDMAQNCITDNAVDAARHGLGVTVLTDTLIGWDAPGKAAWHGDKPSNGGDPSIHAKQVQKTLEEIKAKPAARGIVPSEKESLADVHAAIDTIKTRPVNAFLQSLTAAPASKSRFVSTQAVTKDTSDVPAKPLAHARNNHPRL